MPKLLVAVLAAVVLAACAAGRPPAAPSVVCQHAPQWYSTDAAGRPTTAIYVCFAENGTLYYRARALTPAEVNKMTEAAPPQASVAAPALLPAPPRALTPIEAKLIKIRARRDLRAQTRGAVPAR